MERKLQTDDTKHRHSSSNIGTDELSAQSESSCSVVALQQGLQSCSQQGKSGAGAYASAAMPRRSKQFAHNSGFSGSGYSGSESIGKTTDLRIGDDAPTEVDDKNCALENSKNRRPNTRRTKPASTEFASGEVIFEVVQLAGSLRLCAVDVRTGIEAVLHVPPGVETEALYPVALRKLRRTIDRWHFGGQAEQ